MKPEPHPWRYLQWENRSWFEQHYEYQSWIDVDTAGRLCPSELPVLGQTEPNDDG